MTECAAENGYTQTTVKHVIQRAGVSRETFYQQFSSKQDCFFAALDKTATRLLEAVGKQVTEEPTVGDPFAKVDAFLKSYLEAIVEQPTYARVFLIEVHAAGEEAFKRRVAVQRRFADAVAEIAGVQSEQDIFACRTMIGGIGAIVTARLAAGDIDGIRAMRGQMLDLAKRVLRPPSSD